MRGLGRRRTLPTILIAAQLMGCATPPPPPPPGTDFATLSDRDLCNAVSALTPGTPEFSFAIKEYARRDLSQTRCGQIASGGPSTPTIIGVAAAVAIAAVLLNRSNRSAPAPVGVFDRDWDWDLFQDASGRFVWACRGIQTGQFAAEHNCASKALTDARWPGTTLRW